jgi:hypothetical protein
MSILSCVFECSVSKEVTYFNKDIVSWFYSRDKELSK